MVFLKLVDDSLFRLVLINTHMERLCRTVESKESKSFNSEQASMRAERTPCTPLIMSLSPFSSCSILAECKSVRGVQKVSKWLVLFGTDALDVWYLIAPTSVESPYTAFGHNPLFLLQLFLPHDRLPRGESVALTASSYMTLKAEAGGNC